MAQQGLPRPLTMDGHDGLEKIEPERSGPGLGGPLYTEGGDVRLLPYRGATAQSSPYNAQKRGGEEKVVKAWDDISAVVGAPVHNDQVRSFGRPPYEVYRPMEGVPEAILLDELSSKMAFFIPPQELTMMFPGSGIETMQDLIYAEHKMIHKYLGNTSGLINNPKDYRSLRVVALLNLILCSSINPTKTVQETDWSQPEQTCCQQFCSCCAEEPKPIAEHRDVQVADLVEKDRIIKGYREDAIAKIRLALTLCLANNNVSKISKSGMIMSAVIFLDAFNRVREPEMRSLIRHAALLDPDNMVARSAEELMMHPTLYFYVNTEIDVAASATAKALSKAIAGA